jgi:hypothetical protein
MALLHRVLTALLPLILLAMLLEDGLLLMQHRAGLLHHGIKGGVFGAVQQHQAVHHLNKEARLLDGRIQGEASCKGN